MKSLGNGRTPYRIISSIVLIVLALSVIAPIITFAQMNTQPVNPLPKEPIQPHHPPSKSQPSKGGISVGEKPEKTVDISKIVHKILNSNNALGTSSSYLTPTVVTGKHIRFNVPKEMIDSNVKAFTVHLITGDVVSAIYSANKGKWSISIKPVSGSRKFFILPIKGDVYVIPIGINLKKFDLRLFSIKTLSEYAKLHLDYLPLIIKVVKTKSLNTVEKQLVGTIKALSKHIVKLRIIHSIAVKVPFKELSKVFKLLSSSDDIVKVYPDLIVRIASSKNLRLRIFKPQIYQSVPEIGAPSLWNVGINGSGIKIAILDTGIDPTHPDFFINGTSKIVANASFVDFNGDGIPDESVIDLHGHGTHCAGIAAGVGNYLSNLKGVAPGAQLIAGKVLCNEGWGFTSWIVKGIEWAVNQSADVISMSLGGSATVSYDPDVAAIKNATEHGVLVVVAAGNEGPDYFTVSSPGVAEDALTVGAVDKYLYLAYFSSEGPTPNATLKPDVVAPGVDVASARANNTCMGEPATLKHVYASGTSMATPHVAGLAALVKEYLEEKGIAGFVLEASQGKVNIARLVKDVIVSTATDLGYEPLAQGAGFVNATKIVELVNASELVIIDPARYDLVNSNGLSTLTLTLYNSFNNTIALNVTANFILWSGIMEAVNLSDAIKISPTNLTLGPYSVGYINVTVDFSKIPVGYHALLIKLIDSKGVEVGKALIGVSKPVVLEVEATYAGESVPYVFVAATGYSPVLGSYALSGPDWGWFAESNTGYAVLYPLMPDMVYNVLVSAILPNDSLGSYYFLLNTNNLSKSFYFVNVDFSKITPVTIKLADDLAGDIAYGYDAYLEIINTTSGKVVDLISNPDAWITIENYTTTLNVYAYVNTSETYIGPYKAVLVPAYWNLKAEVQPINFYPSTEIPMSVYYRLYSDAPRGTEIIVAPTYVNETAILANGALGNKTLTGMGALHEFAGPTELDISIFLDINVPSAVTYLVDTNANITYLAHDVVSASFNDAYFSIGAYDFSCLQLSSNLTVCAPLRMPKVGTTWFYGLTRKGLDGYNLTYALAMGDIFRESLTGRYFVYAYGPSYYPPFYEYLIINNELLTSGYTYYSNGLPLIEWYTSKTLNNLSVITVLSEANLTFAEPYLTFHNYAITNATMVIPAPNYTLVGNYYFASWYGVGARDVIPAGGYDYVLNYVPPNSTAYLIMFFDTPYPYSRFDLNLSSVKVYVIGPNGTKIELPIIGWDTSLFEEGISVYEAVVEINSTYILSKAPPGPYALEIEGTYVATDGSGAKILMSQYIYNDIYVGKPPYSAPMVKPKIIIVGPPGSGANYTSIAEAVNAAPEGATILILPGTYEEEMINVNKPLTIAGVPASNGTYPRIVAPNGYPIFVVSSDALIANLTLVPYSEASVPPVASIPLPSDAIVPPAAIICYGGSLSVVDVEIDGYPRGITAYGVPLTVTNLTTYTDSYYLVNGRRAETLEASPVYAYGVPSLVLINVSSNTLPIIRKTYWKSVELSNLLVNGAEVAIMKNETLSLTLDTTAPVIVLGNVVSLTGSAKELEVVGNSLTANSLTVGKLIASTAEAYMKSLVVTSGLARLDTGAVAMENSSIKGSLVITNAKNVSITSSIVEASSDTGVFIESVGSASISLNNNTVSGAKFTDVYVILHDADSLVIKDSHISNSYYGIVVIENYREAAPDVLIEGNTFSNVAIPIYISPAIPASTPQCGVTAYEYTIKYFYHITNTIKPNMVRGNVLNTSSAFISRVYIRYNNMQGADRGVWIGGGVIATTLLGNQISAENGGIVADDSYCLLTFYNNINAENAILLNKTRFAIISYNNIQGNLNVIPYSNSFIDVRYNYIASGNVSIANNEGTVVTSPQYNSEVSIPNVESPIIPWLNATGKFVVGEEVPTPLVFINPNPYDVTFNYRVRVSGAIEVGGEVRADSVKVTTFGTAYDSAIPNMTVKPTASGTASLLVDIEVGNSIYTVTLPLLLKAPSVSIGVKAPSQIVRGNVFNATVAINVSVSGEYYFLMATSKGIGICTGNCESYTFAYVSKVYLNKGINYINMSLIALRTGNYSITAMLSVGYSVYKSKAYVYVLPNSTISYGVYVVSYPSTMNKGYWDSIDIKVENNASVPLWLNITSVSSDSSIIKVYSPFLAYIPPLTTSYFSVPIYGEGAGNATVTIYAIDIDDNITKSTNVTITVLPPLVYNYSVIGYGYVNLTKNEASASKIYPSTTKWADLLMYIYASQTAVSLEKLKNLIEQPWGCVEQTTSPLLAGIEVYKYISIQNIWSDAASSMDMTVDQLKDLLINKTIRYGVKRLIEHHASHCLSNTTESCVLGWYPGLSYDFFYTSYGLLGLVKAYEFQKDYSISVYSSNVTLTTLIEKLIRGLIEHQESDGSWEENIVYTAMATYAIAKAYELGFTAYNETGSVPKALSNAVTWLLNKQLSDGSWDDNALHTAYALQAIAQAAKVGTSVPEDSIINAIEWLVNNKKVYDGGVYWPSGYWFLSKYRVTARAVLALATAKAVVTNTTIANLAYDTAKKGAKYLASTAYEWLRWGNTYAGAQILWAINVFGEPILFITTQPATAYVRIYAGSEEVFNATITISGETWWGCYFPDLTDVDSNDIYCTNYSYIYNGNWLAISKNITLKVELVGNATAYWFADTIYAYYPTTSGTAGGKVVSAHVASIPKVREVMLGHGKVVVKNIALPAQSSGSNTSSYFEIVKTVEPSVIGPGDEFNVTIKVRSLNGTLNYVVLSDTIPSGFKLIKYYLPNGVAFDQQYYNSTGNLGFAIDTLGSDWVVIKYTLQAPSNVALGTTVTLPPASVKLFYEPPNIDTNTTSNAPDVTIGAITHLTSKGVLFSEYSAGVSNGTTLRWGEVLNLTLTTSTPLTNPCIEIEVYNESNYLLYHKYFNGSIAVLDTANLPYTKLAGKRAVIIVKLLENNVTLLAKYKLEISLPTISMKDISDRAKAVVTLWSSNINNPKILDIVYDLAKGTVTLWSIAVTSS